MASVTHEAPETRPAWYTLPEVWASIAISVIWLAVVMTAVWAPNIVTTSVDGSSATIPSGVAVAFRRDRVVGSRTVRREAPLTAEVIPAGNLERLAVAA